MSAPTPAESCAEPERPTQAPLPFPFLTLCWRIGLGGRWVRVPNGHSDPLVEALSADPLVVAGEPCRETRRRYRVGMGRLLRGRATARNGHHHQARPSTDRGATLADVAPLGRCIERSALYEYCARHDQALARKAAWATAALLLPVPETTKTQSFPPIWQPLAKAVLADLRVVYVPQPRPRYDPLTWSFLVRIVDQWESEGLTFLGTDRRQLYLRFGTRRMARAFGASRRQTLACGRAAHRIWRHWYESREEVIERTFRDRLPLPPDLQRTVGDPARVYRAIRHGQRRGEPSEYLKLLPDPIARLLIREAARSITSFPYRPSLPNWTLTPLTLVSQALDLSPLVAISRGLGLREYQLAKAKRSLADSLLNVLTAPWPWSPARCRS